MKNELFFDEQVAIEELQKRGYRVVKEDTLEASSITTIKELVDYFYSRRRYYNPDRKFPFSIDYSADSKYVSSFISSRQKLGLGRKAAITEAALLVDALFKFEEQLQLKTPIISPAILAVRPIMDRVCSFVNGEVAEAGEAENHLFIDEINVLLNKKFAGRDFEHANDERSRILENLRNGERHRNSESSSERD